MRDEGFRERLGRLVSAAALVCSGVALLDPCFGVVAAPGAVLACAGAVWARGWVRCGAVLAACWAVAAGVGPGMPADSLNYFAWLRSLAFDLDIDFRNEWARFGLSRGTTESSANPFAIGPALTWSPFFAVAHGWVLLSHASGHGLHAADGFSAPYVRSAAMGTLAAVLFGAALLTQRLGRLLDRPTAALAILVALLGSPVPYYAVLAPAMSHGVACAAAAVTLALWLDTWESPSAPRWAALGAAVGWLTLCRWQAAVVGLLPAVLAVQQWREGRLRTLWIAGAGAAAALVLLPQFIGWRVLYGSFVTLPQGRGFMDWSSPRLLDVVLSADHGLLLTPVVLLGLAGLLFPGAVPTSLRLGGLAVFAAAAWTNGGVSDYSGSDAFGARRFTFTVPLAAVGLLELLRRATTLARRHPLLFPGTLLALSVAWNVSYAGLAAAGRYRETPTPLERLAGDQVKVLRRIAESAAERLAGAPARALVYKAMVGEYLYQARHLDGALRLARLPEEELGEGWSEPHRRPDGPGFRWAYHPEACLWLPFETPIDLRVAITARAPAGTQPQTLELRINGVSLGAAPLGREWQVLRFETPARFLVPGENRLCLKFEHALPSESGRGVAAAVARVQLP